jgi:hypothetical protein
MPQMINDHSSWVGKGANGKVFPDGAKTKGESSAEGFGKLSHYEDTSDAIKSQQMMNKAKVNGHPQKSGHRN